MGEKYSIRLTPDQLKLLAHVRESIGRLTGVLAETRFREKVRDKPLTTDKTRWFLPTARLQDAERVLELYK